MLYKTMKKGISISMELVVIAVICLIVLAVLLYIFSQKAGTFDKGTSSCGGQCVGEDEQCTDPEAFKIAYSNCGGDKNKNYCCLKTGG